MRITAGLNSEFPIYTDSRNKAKELSAIIYALPEEN